MGYKIGQSTHKKKRDGAGQIINLKCQYIQYNIKYMCFNLICTPGLVSIPIDGNRLALQSLDDEVTHNTPVIRMHARSESIEDARYAYFHVLL
jgi:hypothetical protein